MISQTATATTELDDENLYWVIETIDDHGNEMNIAYTGTYQEARRECHQSHVGATITHWDQWNPAGRTPCV